MLRSLTAGRRGTILLVLALGACVGDGITVSLEPEVGVGEIYDLSAYNGRPIPVTLTSGSTRLEIRKGALTLAADSTWILSYVTRVTTNTGEANEKPAVGGVYRRAGAALTLRYTGDTSTRFSGTYSAQSVVLTDMNAVARDQLTLTRRP